MYILPQRHGKINSHVIAAAAASSVASLYSPTQTTNGCQVTDSTTELPAAEIAVFCAAGLSNLPYTPIPIIESHNLYTLTDARHVIAQADWEMAPFAQFAQVPRVQECLTLQFLAISEVSLRNWRITKLIAALPQSCT